MPYSLFLMLGVDKPNFRGQNNDFGGTMDLELEGTTNKDLEGGQTMILGGPKECLVPINEI